MKRMTSPTVLLALLFIATITLPARAQELMIEIPLSTQVESSSQIIEGEVIAKKSFWDADHNNIYTANTIEIFKIFKGQISSDTVNIITAGGSVGNKIEVVTPSLSLNVGEIGLFMLTTSNIKTDNDNGVNTYKTFAVSQGFYKYNIASNRAANPFVSIQNIASTFYNSITTLTNIQTITEVSTFDVQHRFETTVSNRRTAVTEDIIDFTPTTLNGGVGDILTINGIDFGNTKGTVNFRDANFGGEQYVAALDSQVLSWTNNQITVEIPTKAGTGDFQVVTSAGVTITSNTDLTVFYSQINLSNTTTAFTAQHIDSNGLGGYTWQMHTEFAANTGANTAFSRAFDSWACTTGINWELGSETTVDVIADDGINVIRFDNGTELPQSILGRSTTRFTACNSPSSPGGIGVIVEELDIVFNDVFTGNLSAFSWQFGPDTASGLEIDFESVALHELGHAHLLAHIINPGQVMHYSFVNGQNSRNLGSSDLNGAADIMDRNLNESLCASNVMTASNCSTLSANDWTLLDKLLIFPNPATTNLTISNASNIQLDKAAIYDVSGRLVLSKTLKTNLNNLELSTLQSGVYFIEITSNNSATTRKFVIE